MLKLNPYTGVCIITVLPEPELRNEVQCFCMSAIVCHFNVTGQPEMIGLHILHCHIPMTSHLKHTWNGKNIRTDFIVFNVLLDTAVCVCMYVCVCVCVCVCVRMRMHA